MGDLRRERAPLISLDCGRSPSVRMLQRAWRYADAVPHPVKEIEMKTAFTFLTLAAILLATSPARAIDRFWSCHQVTACNYWWSPSTVVTSDFLSATDLTGQVTYGYVWPQVTSCLQTTTCEWAPPGSW